MSSEQPFGADPAVYQNALQPYKEYHVSTDEEIKSFQSDWTVPEKNTTSADYYFNSYEHHSIHEDMLKDKVRTGAYQQAIMNNPWLFENKIVIDVGAGTGILSLFAAKAGAKKVIAIECSRIAEMGRQIVEKNGYSDVITFVQKKSEDCEDDIKAIVKELGMDTTQPFADIIISEWMGYFLLYESMLDSVLGIRDKFLKKDGLMFPDTAVLRLAGLEDSQYKNQCLSFWENVYSFDYTPMQKSIYEEPVVDYVEQQGICTDACVILSLDLKTCTVADLDFASDFKLRFNRNDTIHAIAAWFETGFTACHRPVVLSTSPYGVHTHWKQTTFYTKHEIVGCMGEFVTGQIAVRKNAKNPRDLDVKIKYHYDGVRGHSDGSPGPVDGTQFYRIC